MISFPEILLRLAVALILGAAVGFEREQKEHAAGLRTLALVSLGCALFTIVSAYGFLELLIIPHTTLDPTRVASYIVAGIGFLGGGTIFLSQQNEKVKGLTTAATIWVVAAVGIACGIGMILEASLQPLWCSSYYSCYHWEKGFFYPLLPQICGTFISRRHQYQANSLRISMKLAHVTKSP